MSQETSNKLIVYGNRWCGMSRRTRTYLETNHIPYEFVDIEADPKAAAWVESVNRGYRSVPTLLAPDGSTLTEPGDTQLAAWLLEHMTVTQ